MTEAQADGRDPQEGAPVHASTWIAVVVTYQRDAAAMACVESLLDQREPFDHVLLIDNGTSAVLADWARGRTDFVYRPMPDNVGPAGAMNEAFRWASELGTNPETTWVVRLDDDRTATPDLLYYRRRFADRAVRADPRTAGIGPGWKRVNRYTGIIYPIERSEVYVDAPVRVDYLGTGWAPAFRLAPALDIGGFDAELFIGFTEVNFGLRLREAGYPLYVPGWEIVPSLHASLVVPETRFASASTPERRYYSLRNEIWTYRQLGKPVLAAFVAVSRTVGATGRQLRSNPRQAGATARNYAAAVRDAYTGRLGRRRTLPGIDATGQRLPS